MNDEVEQMNVNRTFNAEAMAMPRIAGCLDSIFKGVKRGGYNPEVVSSIRESLDAVMDRFSITEDAAVILAALIENRNSLPCEEPRLAQYLGCSNIEFLGFRNTMKKMEEHGILYFKSGRRPGFDVSKEVIASIEEDKPFESPRKEGLTPDEFFSRIAQIFFDLKFSKSDPSVALSQAELIIGCNLQIAFCKNYAETFMGDEYSSFEKRVFLFLAHRFVSEGEESVSMNNIVELSDSFEDEMMFTRLIPAGKSKLQRTGLVTFGGGKDFQDKESLSLSDTVKAEFFPDVTPAAPKAITHRDLIRSSDIVKKELFFNAGTKAQMDRLASLLEPDSFKGVQDRLTEVGMRRGFAVLFYGAPGCGKTAGVYELARKTGRDVFAVDMSALKSKWVGDSEKIVKGVFNTYKKMCEASKDAPILLFNEADALFSRRLENPRDSVDQMNNAIQNICLEAMENLGGILIATTNLEGNFLDGAFARRFIYKVKFDMPDPDTRSKIWESMLKGISPADARTLAQKYPFSGGNIENVARKAAVEYVLSGKKADLQTLMQFCQEECPSQGKEIRRIGFSAS